MVTGLSVMKTTAIALTLSLGLSACAVQWMGSPNQIEDEPVVTDLEQWLTDAFDWRERRLAALTTPDGWLSLVAMDFIDDGDYALGSGADQDLIISGGPDHWGRLVVREGRAWFTAADTTALRIETFEPPQDRPAVPGVAVELQPGGDATATRVHANGAQFNLVTRAGQLGVRGRDAQADSRIHFQGLDYFELDPDWVIEAQWQAHPAGTTIEMVNVLGQVVDEPNPGRAIMTLSNAQGQTETFTLEAFATSTDRLFFVFADQTSGRETFGLGRFLYADAPEAGRVVLDFNRAYNPPCAFNAYTTCALPPAGNRVAWPIRAGEKRYRGPAGITDR